MHFTFATLAALAAFTAAAPTSTQPQVIDFAAIASAPAATITGPTFGLTNQTDVYDSDAAASSAAAQVASNDTTISKRDSSSSVNTESDCAPQPGGYGPIAIPNTVSGFENFPVFDAMAISTFAPLGYTRSFVDYNGSMTGAGYLGLYTLSSYNVQTCAAKCNAVEGCQGFNLFYERNPTLWPAPACPNPIAFTNIKCTLWGLPTSTSLATNYGQYRESFHVVIAGSNGYNLITPSTSLSPLSSFPTFTALAGLVNNAATYITSTYYNAPFDPSVCAAVCQTLTASNKAVALAAGEEAYTPCNFFNAAVLSLNGAAAGMYCAFHSQVLDQSVATVAAQTSAGVAYAFGESLGYAAGQVDAGTV